MIVRCDYCGAPQRRTKPKTHYFCNAEHRDRWMRENYDFSRISRGHKAAHLTKLNRLRNPLCRVAERGNGSSKKARQAAEAYLGRPLRKGEVVHHMNGDATDNRWENLLIMTDREHKQLHMAIAKARMKAGAADG